MLAAKFGFIGQTASLEKNIKSANQKQELLVARKEINYLHFDQVKYIL
jgi:hypothetical protein